MRIEAEEENREMFFYKGLPCIVLKKLNFILKAMLLAGEELKSYSKRRNTMRSVTFWIGSEVGDQRAISLESERLPINQ